MRCLVSGRSGFLGRYVVDHAKASGWIIDALGRSRASDISHDLADGPPELPQLGYDVVYHAAGKAHLFPRTEEDKEAFFRVNTQGTANLLTALERQERLPQAFVLVSTMAVYGKERGEAITEEAPREASDPYGLSKIQAEDLALEWGERHGVRIGIVRLPLVAGAGAPGNLGAMISAIRRGRYMGIGGGQAKRSVVLASDVARILPVVAEKGGIYNLTDGHHPTFVEIERAIAGAIGRQAPKHIPLSLASVGARVGDVIVKATGRRFPLTSQALSKMTSTLTFDDSKARRELGWEPAPVLDHVKEWVQYGGN